ncbi:Immunoglobulin (CD79A) binding protein 1 [Thelotrema lepadinum]|nr:Immunoglobulin (CD79A) binding protein 1 [Thelotrema lepadinum]
MESESNLKALFAKATQLREQLDSLQSLSQEYQDNLRDALSKYEECRVQASQISLFSPNESADDIASGDLKYLSVDYYLGELTPKVISANRLSLLRRAQDAYSKYLGLLDDYELLSAKDKKIYAKYNQEKDTFALLPSHDPTARRETKIARFNQEIELKQKLSYLSQNPHALQNDDSVLRELHLAEVALNTHQTFYSLDLIAQELKMLAQAPPPSGPALEDQRDTRQSNGGSQDGYSERLDTSIQSLLRNGKAGPILNKDGRPLQPFTLLDSRQRLRNGVFRPSHNLPSMTIDEYLEEERRRGGIIDGGGEQPAREVDEDDLELADRETMKAREWDEFKEANPRGAGNTINRG